MATFDSDSCVTTSGTLQALSGSVESASLHTFYTQEGVYGVFSGS